MTAERDEVTDGSCSLAAMYRRAVAREEAERRFVATAAHELRTPLTSLHVTLDLLREDLRSEAPDLEDARAQANRAVAQSARITRLAADLLDLSRLDAPAPLREEPVDLGELARAAIVEFQPARSVKVRLAGAGQAPVWAQGDPEAVARILRIVLDNALRHAPTGTVVTVTAHRRGAAAGLTVCDLGPGVPPEDRERIFERFQRGSAEPRSAGFGLGLALGRELARRMGGDLRLSAAGSPTCFTLVLRADDRQPTG